MSDSETSTLLQQVARNGPRLNLNTTMTLMLISAPFFLIQLFSLGLFSAKSDGMDNLPISIRATSQADYRRDPQGFVVPPVSENILQQIIADIPATGDPQDRAATLQADLSSPVPTMTLNSQSLITPTPTFVLPTTTVVAASPTSPTSMTQLVTATPHVSTTPTTASVNTPYPTLSIPSIFTTPTNLSLPTIPPLLPTSLPLPNIPPVLPTNLPLPTIPLILPTSWSLPTIPPLLP